MFLSTTLLYPLELTVLCLGAGLLVDRVSGSFLPVVLLPTVGLAALIGLSQLSTFIYPLATATPYLAAGLAVAGFVAGRVRARVVVERIREQPWLLLLPVGAYVLALAPVLASGRATFSSYLALADSAVHLVGADYLLHHGQHYAHLDLHNSYGQVVNDYYNSSYPSGSDTAFGASALLIGLPLIWAFQPFNAFVLASATGGAWLLARASGLSRPLAALAAMTALLGALVYAYELFGSIKEVTSLGLILALGALVVLQERWIRSPGRGVIPFALIVAAGVSALGVAFGIWAFLSALVLAPALVSAVFAGGGDGRRMAGGGDRRARCARGARGGASHLDVGERLGAGHPVGRHDQQPGQPHPHVAGHPDVRDLARGQLQARAAGWGLRRDPRARAGGAGGDVAGGVAARAAA